MLTSVRRGEPFELPALPVEAREISDALNGAGHAAYWVGAGLRELIAARRPRSFDLATDATFGQLAERFGRGVHVGARHGTLMIPTAVGPIDATPFVGGDRIEDDLARRDFSVHAMAFDAGHARLFDPYEGLADLSARRLRVVGSASECLARDPLRALRALRLAATHGFALDRELEQALPSVCGGPLDGVPRIAIRVELKAMLMATRPREAWETFERSGIAASLAANSSSGSGALIERLPANLELRLACWLRGTRARRVLQRLRFPRALVDRVEQLLQLHPIDDYIDPSRTTAVARLARRQTPSNLHALIALRRAEIECDAGLVPSIRERLDQIEKAIGTARAEIDRAQERTPLAIDGAEVMNQLGCEPGPHIGRALGYLKRRIDEDPTLNTAEALRTLIERWRDLERAP